MDIAMDLNAGSPTYGDILIRNGEILATSDGNPAGTNFVLQSVVQRLRTFQGEWFLDNTLGTPYFQQILVKGATRDQAELALASVILATPGILSILSLSATYDTRLRAVTVAFTASAVTGPISYTGPIGGSQGAV